MVSVQALILVSNTIENPAHCAKPTTGNPDSQQSTGSQIIRICIGIYRKIDKTVKRCINSYQSIHTVNSENKPRGLYFSKVLFEGLIFGGAYIRTAYLRREICVSKSIGLALQLGLNLPFLLCFTL